MKKQTNFKRNYRCNTLNIKLVVVFLSFYRCENAMICSLSIYDCTTRI